MVFRAFPQLPAQDVWFLSPGIGAQGGDLAAALEAGLRTDGLGILLPISRGLGEALELDIASIDVDI